MRQLATGDMQQLENVVESCRIGTTILNNGVKEIEVLAEALAALLPVA